MTRSIAWDKVAHADVLRAIQEYDRLGPERFFSAHGFAPTTTYVSMVSPRPAPEPARGHLLDSKLRHRTFEAHF